MDGFFKLSEEVIALVENHERFRATLKNCRKQSEASSMCDEIELDFEVIGLPQRRLIAVRNIEPITICIGDDRTMPVVKVRRDFPIVSHLNVHEDNATKSLCLFEQRYEEIQHRMSGRFLLTCIENWFLETSMNSLHRPDQPIEPFFPYVHDVIIWDNFPNQFSLKRFATENREFGNLMYECDKGEPYAVLHLPVPYDYSNLIHNMPQTLSDLIFLTENNANFRLFLNSIGAITRAPNLYNEYFQQAKNKLLACRIIINVVIPKSRAQGEPVETFDPRTFVTRESLKEILADYGLCLNRSKIEASGAAGTNGTNIAIQPFNVHHGNSRAISKIYNGIDAARGNERIALLGVGALGSQILSNSLRMGYGIWTIIDNDFFWPHNIARHVLNTTNIGELKVNALETLAAVIQTDSEVIAISDDIFSGSTLLNETLGCTDIIVDASASIAVERHIALDVKSDARRLSFFLNPSGTATIMILESKDRSERLDLLEMQYYRELTRNDSFANHMLSPNRVVYSGSCRSITSRMSQDDVSISAALCSKALKTYLADETARIVIWTHEDDSVSKHTIAADRWITYGIDDWSIELSESLLEEIKSDRAEFIPNETGGVLIGAFDLARKRVYIVSQIKAPDDSVHAPTSFIRGCANLPEKLHSIDRATLGNLMYIGEWHSHPTGSTQKSPDDIALHNAIVKYNRENCLPACMMIVGTNEYRVFLDE